MHGAVPFLFLATIAIPDVWTCLAFASPFLAGVAVWWLLRRIDQILNHLFPHWEWEKQLGWLNIRDERRADTILRWINHGLHALLAGALYGIVWGVQAVPSVDNWADALVMGRLALRGPVLLFCLGFWLIYLGCALIPKLRAQYEKEELEKFRAEAQETEDEREKNISSRMRSTMSHPRMPIRSNRFDPRR